MSAARAIVVLTGAGISAESGLPTFRDAEGLWEQHRVDDVATPDAFARDPALVHRFYNDRRRHLLDPSIRPNPAHLALAKLERAWPGDFLLVTQNIDNLHERAGSHAVLHVHGELLKARCAQSGRTLPIDDDLTTENRCGCCSPPSLLRPHVVWFGEMPLELGRVGAALHACDLFLSIGTSGQVYPAAGFVEEARAAGARTVELNLEPSVLRGLFAEGAYGPAGRIVPEFVERLLASGVLLK